MRTIRTFASFALGATIVSATPSNRVRKDFFRVHVETQSGAFSEMRLITRGIIYLTGKREPWQVIRKLPVPHDMELAGVGEADIRALDSTVVLVIDAQYVGRDTLPRQHISARAVRVSRGSYGEPFRLMVLPETTGR